MDKIDTKIYCRNCKRDNNHGVVKKHVVQNSDDDDYFWRQTFYIAMCLGCEGITFAEETEAEDMITYNEHGDAVWYSTVKVYPEKPVDHGESIISKKEFNNVPDELIGLYNQVVEAGNLHMTLLSAAGLRMLLEAICKDQAIEDGPLFNPDGTPQVSNGLEKRSNRLLGKINGLVEKKLIVERQASVLHEIREFGNVTVHEIIQPSRSKMKKAIAIIEHIFMTIYDLETYAISRKNTLVLNMDSVKGERQ